MIGFGFTDTTGSTGRGAIGATGGCQTGAAGCGAGGTGATGTGVTGMEPGKCCTEAVVFGTEDVWNDRAGLVCVACVAYIGRDTNGAGV